MKRKTEYVPRKDRVKKPRSTTYTGSSASAAWRRSAAYQRQSAPQETKYFDVSLIGTAGAAADWTNTEMPCTNYIQNDGTTLGAYTDSALIPSAAGSGYGQVNGSKYYLKKLRIKGQVNVAALGDQADAQTDRTVRVVLVHDTQPNGAQAQGEDVFQDMGTPTQNQFNFLAMGSGSGGRFRILKDESFTISNVVAGTDGTNTNSLGFQTKLFSWVYKPSKPIQVNIKPNSTTPNTASLANHNIFVLAHCNSATVAFTAVSRCYYCD